MVYPARSEDYALWLNLGFHPAEIVYHNYQGDMEAYQVFRRAWVEGDRGNRKTP